MVESLSDLAKQPADREEKIKKATALKFEGYRLAQAAYESGRITSGELCHWFRALRDCRRLEDVAVAARFLKMIVHGE